VEEVEPGGTSVSANEWQHCRGKRVGEGGRKTEEGCQERVDQATQATQARVGRKYKKKEKDGRGPSHGIHRPRQGHHIGGTGQRLSKARGRASLDDRNNLPDMLAAQCLGGLASCVRRAIAADRRSWTDGGPPEGEEGDGRVVVDLVVRRDVREGPRPQVLQERVPWPPPTHSGRVATTWGPNATGFVGIPADGDFPPKIG